VKIQRRLVLMTPALDILELVPRASPLSLLYGNAVSPLGKALVRSRSCPYYIV
jgi:hypothetical protein